MARNYKYKKEEIIEASYNLVKDEGIEALSARNVAHRLDSSSKIIFSSFKNMGELKEEVIKLAYKKYSDKMVEALCNTKYKGYVNCGLCYIDIAKKTPNIFKLLFMRDGFDGNYKVVDSSYGPIIETISKKAGITLEEADEVRSKYWFVMHGIATSIATKFIDFEESYIVEILSENYESLVRNIKERKEKQ